MRIYRRTPLASLVAVLVLAIAMAFVSSFLSMYVDFVLKPHPGFEDSSRLVTLGQTDANQLRGLPFGLIERAADDLSSLDDVVGALAFPQQLGSDGEQALIEMVTKHFFDGLRPRLELGRGFELSEHEPDAEPVVVVSHRYWQDKLGGDPDVLGTTIEMSTRPRIFSARSDGPPKEPEPETTDFRIVGVMAPEMSGLVTDQIAMWAPIERMGPLILGSLEQLRTFSLSTFGRRARGASARVVATQMNARYGDAPEDVGLQSGMRLDALAGVVRSISVFRDTRRQLRLFLAGSVLLALVAACNVSLFLLARAPGRRRELGIRMAVGAPLKRLARQLASEAALLVLVSTALGLVSSIWLSRYFRSLAFLRQAEWHNVTLLDWRVLGLVGIFLALLTVLVSLAPVLGLKRLGIAASSRQVAARATLAQRVAGTAQIAIAAAVGGAAVAFGWYLAWLMFSYPGYETRNLFVAQFSPVARDAPQQVGVENAVVEFSRRREAIEALPGVTGVTFGNPVPGAQTGTLIFGMQDPSDPAKQLQIRIGMIDDDFVDLLGLRLVAGRIPTESDGPVALVNQALAREVWGRDDVVGESVPFRLSGGDRTEIVGVLEDVSFGHPTANVQPMLFTTLNTSFFFSALAVIRSTLSAADLQQELQGLIDDGGLELTINSVRTLDSLRSDLIAADRARSFLTIVTASLVVLLAAFGFYGTQRYLVMAGRREYAIRASLGAGPRALGRLVLVRGLALSLPGLAFGSVLAFIAVTWLREDFVSRDISAMLVTVAVASALAALLLAAGLGPARQARRTQPAPLLRED